MKKGDLVLPDRRGSGLYDRRRAYALGLLENQVVPTRGADSDQFTPKVPSACSPKVINTGFTSAAVVVIITTFVGDIDEEGAPRAATG